MTSRVFSGAIASRMPSRLSLKAAVENAGLVDNHSDAAAALAFAATVSRRAGGFDGSDLRQD
jgi:hypothetical protein